LELHDCSLHTGKSTRGSCEDVHTIETLKKQDTRVERKQSSHCLMHKHNHCDCYTIILISVECVRCMEQFVCNELD
jgi:hypothetical protein